jgi:hypothetical protein
MSMMLRFAICAAAVLGAGECMRSMTTEARAKELEGLGHQ